MLLGRGAGHRDEPVRVVRRPVGERPLLHPVRDRVDDGPIERLMSLDRPPQLLEDRLGEVLALGLFVEHVLAVDIGSGLLEVVLRLGNAMGSDIRDRLVSSGQCGLLPSVRLGRNPVTK